MTEEKPSGLPRKRSEGSGDSQKTHGGSKRKRTRRLRKIVALSAATLILFLIASGWLVHRAQQLRSSLESSVALLPDLQDAIALGDSTRAAAITVELQEHTGDARLAGADPLWKAAGLVPFVGQNFNAMSEVAVSADDVVNRAVAPMIDKFAVLNWDSFTPVEGRIDAAPLADLAPTLSSAANTIDLSYERLKGIDRDSLLPQIAEPLEKAVEELDDARGPIGTASRVSRLLPSMLGTGSQQSYLVLVQNSAEIRTTGGIPGALAVISINDGRISLTEQGSASELGRFDPPIAVVPEQEQIYSYRMGAFMQSVNLTPDFPTAAYTAKTMWEQKNEGASIDGVVALDPVVLANLLSATGPVELRGFDDPAIDALLAESELPQTLDSTNVVPTLLSDVYAQIDDPALQDEYFAAVAAEVFEALASSRGDGKRLVEALVTSSDQGRLYLWSAKSDDQDLLAETRIAGAATGPLVGGASFGAYFNDGTGAKMDYYVRRTVQLVRKCSETGYSDFTMRVTLTNTAPVDAATSLPEYVTGAGAFGVPPGRVQTNTVAYGPAQALLQTARINGEDVPVGSYSHGGRPVGILTTQLGPGESATLEVDFTKVVQEGDPVLDVTPTLQDLTDVILPLESSGPCVSRR